MRLASSTRFPGPGSELEEFALNSSLSDLIVLDTSASDIKHTFTPVFKLMCQVFQQIHHFIVCVCFTTLLFVILNVACNMKSV